MAYSAAENYYTRIYKMRIGCAILAILNLSIILSVKSVCIPGYLKLCIVRRHSIYTEYMNLSLKYY